MKSYGLIFTMLCSLLLLASCSKDDADTGDGMSTLQVRMTDAPGPYDEVNVDIQQVEVHSDVAGWQTLNVNAGVYNLLDYMNGVDTLIASNTIAVGTVSQIRLILGPNNTVVVNGVSHNLSTPSAEQSGLKLNIHQVLEAGITYAILLDFDAARSIHQTGNGTYKLRPVIRALAVGTDGVIRGTISPLASAPTIYAVSGTDTSGAFISANGEFMIQGLTTGTYDLVVQPIAPFSLTVLNNVSVTAGHTTNVGVVTVVQ